MPSHYNAPHVIRYSFAILLWEMLSLKTPYELYAKSLREKVYNGTSGASHQCGLVRAGAAAY
jgi:hypothetical protein